MTKTEVKKLVDKGRGIKEKMDALEAELDKIKKSLREEAKLKKLGYFLGEKHFCRVGPMTRTECGPHTLYETFVEMDREDEFYECVSVLVGESKSKLGETIFGSISSTKSEAYKKVSFLSKIPKKYLE